MKQFTSEFLHRTPVEVKNTLAFCKGLVDRNRLGKKAKCGLYRRYEYVNGRKEEKVFDIENHEYREVMPYQFAFKEQIIKRIHEGEYKRAADILIKNQSPEVGICLEFLLEYILYSLATSLEVGEDIHSAYDYRKYIMANR